MSANSNASSSGFSSQRLYQDRKKGLVCGVCAGIAEYFGFDLTVTRVLVAFSLVFFFPPTILAYIVLALLLPKKPENLSADYDEARTSLQKRVRSEPHSTLDSVRHRSRELDLRVQRLEKYLTSNRFNLDREFESLKD